jgi:tyrosine-protein phosphatase SIW14
VVQSSIPPDDPKIPPRLRPTLPPINYGTVVKGSVYRSGYPAAENFKFLKGLGLKTIMSEFHTPFS